MRLVVKNSSAVAETGAARLTRSAPLVACRARGCTPTGSLERTAKFMSQPAMTLRSRPPAVTASAGGEGLAASKGAACFPQRRSRPVIDKALFDNQNLARRTIRCGRPRPRFASPLAAHALRRGGPFLQAVSLRRTRRRGVSQSAPGRPGKIRGLPQSDLRQMGAGFLGQEPRAARRRDRRRARRRRANSSRRACC